MMKGKGGDDEKKALCFVIARSVSDEAIQKGL
jgi:hypothetical protein